MFLGIIFQYEVGGLSRMVGRAASIIFGIDIPQETIWVR
jgi:hypothetical protein